MIRLRPCEQRLRFIGVDLTLLHPSRQEIGRDRFSDHSKKEQQEIRGSETRECDDGPFVGRGSYIGYI
jgi:hypothetical protein